MKADPRELKERLVGTQVAKLRVWQLPTAIAARWKSAEVEAEPGTHKSSSEAQSALWDTFWTKHGPGKGLTNAVLWKVRNILSSRHAKILVDSLEPKFSLDGLSLRTIEIGCGSAATSLCLQTSMPNALAYGIDRSIVALQLARSINPTLRCVVADASKLPFAEGAFELAFSSGVIEHFSRAVAGGMLEEHHRVISGRGKAAVVVPWKYSAFNVLRIVVGQFWPFGEEDPFSVSELNRFGSKHGVCDFKVHLVLGSTLLAIGTKARKSGS